MSELDVMAGAGPSETKGQALYHKLAGWRKQQETLTGDDLIAVWKFIEWWNAVAAANKKAGIPPITDGPEIYEVVLAIHPRLVCTEQVKPEWFSCGSDNLYEPIPVIEVAIGSVLHLLNVKTEGWKRRVADIAAALVPKCTIKGLTRRPCLISWKDRSAKDFDSLASPCVGAVACKTKWYTLQRDGGFAERPYSPAVFLLDRLPADPADVEPKFTNQWMVERLGDDQAKALWEWMAYLLSPGNTIGKRFHLWIGPKDTGKSTAVALLQTLLGERNVSFQPAAELEKPFVRSDLRGKLLNVSEEDSGYGHEFEHTVKRITGGTDASFEVKYGSSGNDLPTYRLLFTSNDTPNIVDPSGAFADRMIVLSWTKVVTGKKAGIAAIDEKFAAELPGILWRCLNLRRGIIERRDLYVPAESEKLLTQIALDSNTVATWQKEETWLSPNITHTKDAIYGEYSSWCMRGHYKPYSYNAFWQRFRNLDCWKTEAVAEDGRASRGEGRRRKVRGLALAETDTAEAEAAKKATAALGGQPYAPERD